MSNDETKKFENRMKELYRTGVVPEMMKRHNWTNALQVPRIQKVVVNVGLSEARENAKVVDLAAVEIAAITGQKAQVRRAKKAISNFKLREGMPIGTMVTLRRERMWTFLERLVHLSLPRVRDFRGLSPRGFDGRGNYNMGLKEQIIFPEIDYERVDSVRGMNITICTSAKNDNDGRALLEALGMPFRKK